MDFRVIWRTYCFWLIKHSMCRVFECYNFSNELVSVVFLLLAKQTPK